MIDNKESITPLEFAVEYRKNNFPGTVLQLNTNGNRQIKYKNGTNYYVVAEEKELEI